MCHSDMMRIGWGSDLAWKQVKIYPADDESQTLYDFTLKSFICTHLYIHFFKDVNTPSQANHEFPFYALGPRGGVKLMLKLHSTATDIVDPSGAEETLATRTVASVVYYDLSGRAHREPQPGMVNIVRTTYTDGSTTASKVQF